MVARHHGNENSGHYDATVRVDDSVWRIYSDANVHELGRDDSVVAAHSAHSGTDYLLVYHRQAGNGTREPPMLEPVTDCSTQLSPKQRDDIKYSVYQWLLSHGPGSIELSSRFLQQHIERSELEERSCWVTAFQELGVKRPYEGQDWSWESRGIKGPSSGRYDGWLDELTANHLAHFE